MAVARDATNNDDALADDLPINNPHHWGYGLHPDTDEIPPANWSQVSADSAACKFANQSPISINDTNALEDDALVQLGFSNYDQPAQADRWLIYNNGHTVQINATFDKKPTLTIKSGSQSNDYEFLQMHFHWGADDSRGSEHIINGEQFPLELHLVHTKVKDLQDVDVLMHDPTGLAVLGVMFRVGTPAQLAALPAEYLKELDEVIQLVKLAKEKLVMFNAILPGLHLTGLLAQLDASPSYYRYSGSLTTPPCAEVVVWSVLKDPILISDEQLAIFRSLEGDDGKLIDSNFRPLQDLNKRQISLFSSGGDKGGDTEGTVPPTAAYPAPTTAQKKY
ncbi:putative Carbonic anhydrase 2 [Hypsibius exemplaris]|uniref:Carbonic anhydrase n=1 Tax=Hypsibius exemplaris TaxID=2072580 RepID=A0A1W0WQ59_HYPEX|nr:putative Carbonic anhydrase 2 [Hypsibius exemplaris]